MKKISVKEYNLLLKKGNEIFVVSHNPTGESCFLDNFKEGVIYQYSTNTKMKIKKKHTDYILLSPSEEIPFYEEWSFYLLEAEEIEKAKKEIMLFELKEK